MKKYLFILSLLLFLTPFSVSAENIEVQLEKCVDGDTAKFKSSDGNVMTYRFLAIDTPETVHPTKGEEVFGKEASDYTCNALTNASRIVLELDDAADEKDYYDRGLAWVFVDDILLQEQLVAQGYAKVAYLYGDYKYTSLLQEKEAIAKANKLGIWSDEKPIHIEEKEKEEERSQKEEKKKKNFFEMLIDSILDAITASINRVIDSILQSLEDML